MNRMSQLKIAAALTVLGLFAAEASAATIRVQCEQRGTSRSKISVDGNNLPAGTYRAQIMSGSNAAQTNAQAAIGDEVEFDFDSAPNDIAQGATAVTPSFIQKGQVTGKIVDATGATVISDTVTCRVRR
jgi:hypothetical protein